MTFEIRVVGDMPLEAEHDLDVALKKFLEQIGYLAQEREDTVGFKIFRNCFLKRPEKVWSAGEIAHEVKTSKPTVYRYIRKLKNMGLIESSTAMDEDEKPKKGYRMNYGDFVRAWSFVESHVKVSMENYRRSVEHIARLAKEEP